MRKYVIFCLLAAFMAVFTLSGCKKSHGKDAEKRIEELTKEMKLPMKLNDATTLTKCYYADKTLTYCNETSADTLAAINVDSLKQVTLRGLKANSQKLVSSIVKAKAQIRYMYISDSDTIMFTFSPDDLK